MYVVSSPPIAVGGNVEAQEAKAGEGAQIHSFSFRKFGADALVLLGPWLNYAEQTVCPAVPLVECEPQHIPEAVYVIPTANVASLDFLSVEKMNERTKRRFAKTKVRVSIRHGARKHEEGCLAYLGATGSMQFFTDLPSTSQADEGDDRCEGDFEPANPLVVVVPVPRADVEAKDDPVRNEQPENAKSGSPRREVIDRGGPGDAPTVEGGEDGAASGERTGEGEGSTARAGEVPRYELTEGGAVEAEAPANVRTVVMVVGDPARPEYAGEDWLPRCDMKFAAWVGPFAEGAHDIGSDLDKDGECFKTVKRLNVEKYPNEGIVGVSQWWRRAESEDVQRLILVGRADREPISNDIHFSNFSLAQSRANWVKEQLSKAGTRELHVLSIPSGPTTPHKVDPCDRVVEIHMCSGPPDIGNTGADNSGANDEDRQGAGGGVEERP